MYLHQIKPDIVKTYEADTHYGRFQRVRYIVIKCPHCNKRREFTAFRFKTNNKPVFCSRECKIDYCCTHGIKIKQYKRYNKKRERKIDIRKYMIDTHNVAYEMSKGG